jgi:hypothetical protein
LLVAELRVEPTSAVERAGLSDLVTGGGEQVEGLLAVVQGVDMAAEPRAQKREIGVAVGEADAVTGSFGPVEGVLKVGVGVVMATEKGVCAGEEAVGHRPRGRIGQPFGCGHRGVLGGQYVVPVPAPEEEVGQYPCQLPGVGVQADGRGMVRRGEQDAMFCGEPFEGLLAIGEAFRGDAGMGLDKGDPVAGGVQEQAGVVRGVQVMVEDPAGGGVVLVGGIGAVHKFGGVGAEQVVNGVAAGSVFDDQVGGGEFGQQRSHLGRR